MHTFLSTYFCVRHMRLTNQNDGIHFCLYVLEDFSIAALFYLFISLFFGVVFVEALIPPDDFASHFCE